MRFQTSGRNLGITLADARLEDAVRRWGRTALSFDLLLRRDQYRFFESRLVPGALIPYQPHGGVDVVMGEPLAPEQELGRVAREFFDSRHTQPRPLLGFATTREFALASVEAGAAAVQLLREPELDPQRYSPSGHHAKKLRSYVRRLQKIGFDAVSLPAGGREIPASFKLAAERVIALWVAHGPRRAAHLLEVDPWILACQKRYFAVFDPNDPERVCSLLIAHPVFGRSGWHFCHLMHDPTAPRGVNELNVLNAIKTLAEEGCRYVTFGPFADSQAGEFLGVGALWRSAIDTVYNRLALRAGYARSLEFYEKVQAKPFTPRYLILSPRRFPLPAILAAVRLTHALGV